MTRDFLNLAQHPLPYGHSRWQLRIEPERTWIECDAVSGRGIVIAPGIDTVVREHFTSGPASAMGMESAIAAIEDELARVPRTLHGVAIVSDDAAVLAIAEAAGIAPPDVLHVDAVKRLFERVVAVASGRPAGSDSLPVDPSFSAAVLVMRELMHHLAIASISLEPAAGKGSVAKTC